MASSLHYSGITYIHKQTQNLDLLHQFYQELLKENSNPQLKGNRKGIIVKGKEFYIPILNTFPTYRRDSISFMCDFLRW